MGTLKTSIARARRIELNRARRRSFSLLQFGDDLWGSVVSHASGGHKLQLGVDDDGRVLECLECGIPIVSGSDDVMDAIMEQIRAGGVEFKVLCETMRIQQ